MEGNSYQPGLHLVATLSCPDKHKLCDINSFMAMVHEQIQGLGLNSLGTVEHSFGPNSGYTAVVCLTESHLSVHTWPEFGLLTFDVFLSNFMKNNDDACRMIYESVKAHFNAAILNENELRR